MRIKLKKNITLHKLKNKISLYDGEASTLYTLNDSATFILNGLKMDWEKSKIVNDLKEKFGATDQEAQEDYQQVLNFLEEKQMIEKAK